MFELAEEKLVRNVMSIEREVQELIVDARVKLKEAAGKICYSQELTTRQKAIIWNELISCCGRLLGLRDALGLEIDKNRR